MLTAFGGDANSPAGARCILRDALVERVIWSGDVPTLVLVQPDSDPAEVAGTTGGLLAMGRRHLSASRNEPGRHHRIGGRAPRVGAWPISPNRVAMPRRDVGDQESELVSPIPAGATARAGSIGS